MIKVVIDDCIKHRIVPCVPDDPFLITNLLSHNRRCTVLLTYSIPKTHVYITFGVCFYVLKTTVFMKKFVLARNSYHYCRLYGDNVNYASYSPTPVWYFMINEVWLVTAVGENNIQWNLSIADTLGTAGSKCLDQ